MTAHPYRRAAVVRRIWQLHIGYRRGRAAVVRRRSRRVFNQMT